MDDMIFYFTHRMFHHPKIYKYMHKQHHENRLTYGIASEYAHPFEYIFGNGLPAAMGAKILGKSCHLFTYWMWVVVRSVETVDGHSGYDLPWSPFRLMPFSAGGAYHDFHHAEIVGNYSSFFTIWDTLFCTNEKYYNGKSYKRLVINSQDK